MDSHRPILLTTPDGTHSLINTVKDLSLQDKPSVNKISEQGEEEPESPNTESSPYSSEPMRTPQASDNGTVMTPTGGVQFDSEQIQRGRSRIKRRSDFVAKNNENDSNSSRSRSRSFSRSRSRSRSRTASRIRDEEFLKWTVLRQDPSMRLHNYKMKYNHKTKRYVADDEDGGRVYHEEEEEEDEDEGDNEEDDDDEEDEEEDEEDEDEEEDEDDEESDEEQVSDIENDASINEQFNYDLGTKVLPNFCISINEVLESSTPWIVKYESEPHNKQDDDINITKLEGGYIRGVLTLSKEGPPSNGDDPSQQSQPAKETNDSYILYVDLTSESIYAITYVMGTLVKNGDTVYIVHWHSDRKDSVSDADISKNIVKLRNTVLHLFDCINATIDSVDVVILSLTHPYPKHLLNEMINGLQPIALCCSLSMTLSGLQNFVCSVPTFIIRKKLKRAKKKGIFD